MDDLTREFLIESQEGLDRMERCLTDLEERPRNTGLLAEIFRSVHTIKGTTGFLGFKRLEKLAHAGENLLGLLRDGKLLADAAVITALLQLLDGLRAILKIIETEGGEGAGQRCSADRAAGRVAGPGDPPQRQRLPSGGPCAEPEAGSCEGRPRRRARRFRRASRAVRKIIAATPAPRSSCNGSCASPHAARRCNRCRDYAAWLRRTPSCSRDRRRRAAGAGVEPQRKARCAWT